MDRKLLRAREVAYLLGLGRSTVYELMDSGVLSSIRIGNIRRIPAYAVEAFLAERGACPPAEADAQQDAA